MTKVVFNMKWEINCCSCIIKICRTVDKVDDPHRVRIEAEKESAICILSINGDDLNQFCNAVQVRLKWKVLFHMTKGVS